MDPLTALAIQGGLAGAQAGYGLYQNRQAKKSLAMMDDPLAVTPSARLEVLNAAKDQTVANQALEEINRSLGTSVGALQNAGARAAGMIGGVQRNADAAKSSVLARQKDREAAAQSQALQGEERDRFQRVRQSQQDRAQLQQAQSAGVQNIGNAASSLAAGLAQTDFSSMGGDDNGKEKNNEGLSRSQRRSKRRGDRELGIAKQEVFSESNNFGKSPDIEVIEDEFVVPLLAAKGGKAKKTPGSFSHKTNPLHIIADGGSKVGEMTGGEYIFNPSQASSLRKHSKGGSSPLHKFVRQMLSKSQFK